MKARMNMITRIKLQISEKGHVQYGNGQCMLGGNLFQRAE